MLSCLSLCVCLAVWWLQAAVVHSFTRLPAAVCKQQRKSIGALYENKSPNVEQYDNPLTKLISNLLPATSSSGNDDSSAIFEAIDWQNKKRLPRPLTKISTELSKALREREWYVTGLVDPSYFSDSFRFQDPDVKVEGIRSYAEGVRRLFRQSNSRGIFRSVQIKPNQNIITVTWRLDASVNLPVSSTGLKIKPFVVETDFHVDGRTGLITFQEDRFLIPAYDILLSSFFPFLNQLLMKSTILPPIEEEVNYSATLPILSKKSKR